MDMVQAEQALLAGQVVRFTLDGRRYFIQPENNKGWDYLGLWQEDGFPVCLARAFFDMADGIDADTVRELLAQPGPGGLTVGDCLARAEA